MIKKLYAEAGELIERELERANKDHPLFNSDHEGYAIMREEFEEASDELKKITDSMDCLWEVIKSDAVGEATLVRLKQRTRYLIAEAVQFGAMVEKFEQSRGKRNAE